MKRRLSSPLLCAAALLGTSVSHAVIVEFTWTGSGINSSISTAGNWSGNVAPALDGNQLLIFPDSQRGFVDISSGTASGLQVAGHHHLRGAESSFALGSDGLTYTASFPTHLAFEGLLAVNLTADQPWNIGPGARVEFYDSAFLRGTGKMTKTGAGTIDLGSSNQNQTWTGGLQFNEGAIVLRPGYQNQGTPETSDDTFFSYSLGAGTVTVGPDTANIANRPVFHVYEWSNSSFSSNEVEVGNNFVLHGTFNSRNETELILNGSVTLKADTTFRTAGSITVIEGPIGEADDEAVAGVDSSHKLIVDSTSAIVLSGSNNWTGGTEVTKGILIFAGDVPNLPLSGNILIGAQSYAGIGVVNSIASFIGMLDPASTGTIGFDSDVEVSLDHFNAPIDLSGFAPGSTVRLGTATAAVLDPLAVITPQGTDYRFGGGGGVLTVASPLTGAHNLVLDSPADRPLTVRLTNSTNNFSGTVDVTNSGLIFGDDLLIGTFNLPAGTYTMNAGSYIGTEDSDVTPADFLSHFSAATAGIIGFDIDQSLLFPATRVIDLTAVALGSLTGGGYLGTASALYSAGEVTGPGVRFTGTIAPNSDNVHRFAAYKGGALEVAGLLSGSGLIIGHPDSLGAFGDRTREEYSTVLITGNNGTGLAGGTTLYGGRLMLGHNQALGSGTLTIAPVAFSLDEENGPETPSPMLSTYDTDLVNDIVISNPIVVNAGELNLGGDSSFTLAGVISGAGGLYVGEESTFGFTLALSGANTFSGGVYVTNTAVLRADNDSALGTGMLDFGASAGRVEFSTTAPIIHGLESNTSSAQVWLTNPNSARLRIVQTADTSYQGELRADSGTPGTNGVFVKEGAGTLRLDGVNIYGYGQGSGNDIIEVKAGTLVLADVTLESSSVTLKVNGGTLALDNNEFIANPISVIAGKLAGNGTFSSLISLPTATGLTPGLNGAGTLTFSGGLSLTGGAVMDFGLGRISDRILVTGGTLTGPASGTVTLNISTLDGFKDGTYALLDWSGASLSNLTTASFDIGNVPAGMLTTDFTLSVSGTTLLAFTPVPEPSTYALMLVGLGLIALHVKRRRKG